MTCFLQRDRALTLVLMALVLAVSAACAELPTQAMKDAENALKGASSVSECAQGDYAAAQRAFDEAKALVEEGEYEEAALKAVEARKLAVQAEKNGKASWEECQRAKNPPKEGSFEVDLEKLETVYFDFNESALNEKSKKILQSNAAWLKDRPQVTVTIEGHCDEQGSTDFNLALGELRAGTVKKYLVQLGVSSKNLSVVSYGAEMPVDLSLNAGAFQKNRRAEFKVNK